MVVIVRGLVVGAVLLSGCSDPFAADGSRAYTRVTTGGEHSCAISETAEAYCWGRGEDGQLGTGSKANRARPGKVVGDLKFMDISAGDSHTCALAIDAAAYCWGWNAFFQRGNGEDTRDSEPVRIQSAHAFSSLSAGAHHTCAIGLDSLAYCWGWNRYGQLGNGTTDIAPAALPVAGAIKFVQLTSGAFHTCGVTGAGVAYCWGANEFAQLGAGSGPLQSSVPLEVAGGISFRQIDAGRTHTCATAVDDRFYCWGSAEYGELGNGSAFKAGLPGAFTPQPVSTNFPTGTAIFAGTSHTCAIAHDGAGRCWGRGQYGQLANGATRDSYYPQPVILFRQRTDFTTFGLGGATHACGIVERSVFCWGTGRAGALGVEQSTFVLLPQRIQD